MRDFSQDHRWLSINTATVRKSRGADLPLPDIIEACARRGIRAISPWRDQVAAAGLDTISSLVKTHGLELSGYCRGGMFPAPDVVLADPPRAGLHARVVAELLRLAPPRVVYVSCNAASAVRDLCPLVRAGYALAAIEPLDLFPHTPHLETVFTLERR